MIIRNIDQNGDWVFGKGSSDYRKDLEATKIDLNTRLQSWKFDCFFALEEGVDYKNNLDRNTKIFLDQDIKRVVLQTQNILRINEYVSEIDEETRQLTVSISVATLYGNIENFTFSVGG